jgi:subfamily B ATP-binding cassette protein HlyB/CyaB
MLTALISLEIAGAINNIPIDNRAIVKEFALSEDEPTIEELVKIAKSRDFKASIKSVDIIKLATNYPMPIIAEKQNGTYFVILKYDKSNDTFLISKDGKSPVVIGKDELDSISSKRYIVLKHKMFTASVKFGFGWFIEQILKYKKIMVEILIASFIIQLFGLVAPLFTQVILDKVLVHHSLSTLNVLAVAFVAVTIFEFLMNMIRNYMFIHTTSKIDAKLGAKIFDHLLSLPFTYFENRKVGNIIARVRELDQIREFIANKSVTVLLDVLFSVVFVVVMFIYSVKLTFLVLGFVTILALLYFFITPRLRARLETKFETGAQSNAYLVEAVTGVETVKSLCIEGSMQKRWDDYLANYVDSGFYLTNLSNTFNLSSMK